MNEELFSLFQGFGYEEGFDPGEVHSRGRIKLIGTPCECGRLHKEEIDL